MLSTAERDSMFAAAEATIETLGVPAGWIQSKSPNATKSNLVIGFRTLGFRDEELINAFGVGAKVLTVRVSDLPTVEKFDRFTVLDEVYTIDTVMPVHLNGIHIFHKCFVKGK